MEINGTIIEDTHAEAFAMWACRLIVTAVDEGWARTGAVEACGYGASIIGCDAEAGLECGGERVQTPDGRAGMAVLMFARQDDGLEGAVINRVGQCLLTCPTTAIFDGLPDADGTDVFRVPVGKDISYFGDGHQEAVELHGRRCWRVPVMDGWFVVEESVAAVRAVGGGNFLICGDDQAETLGAAQRAVSAIASVPSVITPFPGGVVRSGSKVGSRYEGVMASTNDAYCPDLRMQDKSRLREGVECVYEIVVNGLSQRAVVAAMRAGITAACGEGVIAISAGNYGGRLGKTHLPLRQIMADAD